MDSQRFDRIARAVARTGTRRALLAGAGSLAGVVALKPFAAAARCQTCGRGKRACGHARHCFGCAGGRRLDCNANQAGGPLCCTNTGNCTSANRTSCPNS